MATAPPAERWLLIECREGWPRDALAALRYSQLDPEGNEHTPASRGLSEPGSLGAEVARLCSVHGWRPVLVRRAGRIDHTVTRRWALVDSRPGTESIRWGDLPTDEHLLDVLVGADPGQSDTEPIYLVCTHGRHDPCCAVRGRPAAAALAAAYPDRTWECSHIGGDRFAANLVFLPHSLFYGQVPSAKVVDLAQAYDEGSVLPEWFRGSGALSPSVQAAQHFARTAGYSTSVDALRPIAVQQPSPDRWRVDLDHRGRPVTVEVAVHLTTVDGRLTCAAQPPGHLRRFTLERPLPPPDPLTEPTAH